MSNPSVVLIGSEIGIVFISIFLCLFLANALSLWGINRATAEQPVVCHLVLWILWCQSCSGPSDSWLVGLKELLVTDMDGDVCALQGQMLTVGCCNPSL